MPHMKPGLAFYSRPHELYKLEDGQPLRATFDGRIGGIADIRVFLRNDKSTSWYSGVQISVVDTEGNDITDGSTDGFYWKLARKDVALSHEEWDQIAMGNTLSIGGTIGDSVRADVVTYIPIWVRIAVPARMRVQRITDVVLRIDAQETEI